MPTSLIDSLIEEGRKQKITPKDDTELQQALPSLRLQLKALIARDLWDMSEYYQVMNENNHTVQRAISLLQ